MQVLEVRNVHEALPRALKLLVDKGNLRDSRNGKVIVAPWPVTTVYHRPQERVMFWAERDANPFLHLYESLWMLQGRNDVAPLTRYTKQFNSYSDDGTTLHGAYGHRWRHPIDQLALIAYQLQRNPDDRRCVLQMWRSESDLGGTGKDVPCNLAVTFQRDQEGRLDMTVFCRSNDIVWGAYGANAVHFSVLLEYMSIWIGCPMGVYRQISVNWHGYLDTLEKVKSLPNHAYDVDPYGAGKVNTLPMFDGNDILSLQRCINIVMSDVDSGIFTRRELLVNTPWLLMAYDLLHSHHVYSTTKSDDRAWAIHEALAILEQQPQRLDWVVAAREWFYRRVRG